MADIRFANTQIQDTSELEVLMALKNNIFRNLKVGSFAKVVEIDEEEKVAIVSLMPLYNDEIEINIQVVIPDSIMIRNDDIVVILFLDRNFKQSLKQALKQQKTTKLDNTIVALHNINYGVIIANMSYNYLPTTMIPITDEEIDNMFYNLKEILYYE